MTSYQESDSLNRCYSVEEQSCQIVSQSDLKRQSLRLFKEGRPKKKNKKMSGNMGSVPDPRICYYLVVVVVVGWLVVVVVVMVVLVVVVVVIRRSGEMTV